MTISPLVSLKFNPELKMGMPKIGGAKASVRCSKRMWGASGFSIRAGQDRSAAPGRRLVVRCEAEDDEPWSEDIDMAFDESPNDSFATISGLLVVKWYTKSESGKRSFNLVEQTVEDMGDSTAIIMMLGRAKNRISATVRGRTLFVVKEPVGYDKNSRAWCYFHLAPGICLRNIKVEVYERNGMQWISIHVPKASALCELANDPFQVPVTVV